MEAGPKEEKPNRGREYDSMGERRLGLDDWACCVGALLKFLHAIQGGYGGYGGCRGLTGHHGGGCGGHHGGWGYPEVQNFQNAQWKKVWE